MAAEYPDYIRGIGFPWTRIGVDTIDATNSNYTQAGPEAGTTTGASRMRIDATGTPTTDMTVRCMSAGVAGRAGSRVVAKTGTGEYHGWDLPSGIRGREVLANISGTTTPPDVPNIIGLSDGTLMYAEARESANINTVRVHRQAPGSAWTTAVVSLASTSGTKPACPTLVDMGGGRVLLLVLVYSSGASEAQVRQLFSGNSGGAWTVGNGYILDVAIDTSTTTIERMSAAYSKGQTSLFMGLAISGDKRLGQWASNDEGSSFTFISHSAPGAGLGARHPDVCATPGGGFCVVFTNTATTTGTSTQLPTSVVLGSAYDDIASATVGQFDDVFDQPAGYSGNNPRWPAICIDDQGTLWRYNSSYDPSGTLDAIGLVGVSYDGGTTWERVGGPDSDPKQWWAGDGDTAFPWRSSVAFSHGSVYLAHYYQGRTSGLEGGRSPAVFRLGGFTTLTLPAATSFVSNTNGLAYSLTYAGMASPTAYGLSLTGTATESLDGDGWLTVETSGTRVDYTDAVATDHVIGQFHHIVAHRKVGGFYMQSVVSDGADAWGVLIEWGSSGIDVEDLTGANQQGLPSAEFFAITDAAEFLIAVSSSGYTVGIRPAGNSETPFYIIQNPIATSTGATSERFRFGTIADGNPPNQFRTISYARATSTDFAVSIANAFTSPTNLRGFPLSGAPRYVLDGISLAAVGGPAQVADTWQVPVRYSYPLANLWTDTSLDEWRSVAATSDMGIAWTVEALDDGLAPSEGILYILLENVNFKEFILEQSDGVGSTYPITVADVSLATAFAFTRTGHQIRPVTTGAVIVGAYVKPDQLVGSQIELPSGEVVPITGNTSGFLTSGSATVKRTTITVKQGSVDNSSSISGSAEIWHSRAVIYVHGADDVASIMRLRIHHNSPADPYTGDYRAGTIEIGAIRPFSRSYDWGRRIGYRSNVEVIDLANGSTRARRLGPKRRTMAVNWNEGLLTREGSHEPIYSTTGEAPVASSRDTAYVVSTLPDAADVVSYHPKIPKGPTTVVDFTGEAFRLRLDDVTWESITGIEGVDEMVRIGLTGTEAI